jgi:two-component system chemotaxis response regulator CheY
VDKQQIQILVVDDDRLMRELLKGILRDEGYGIAGEAVSGDAALEQLEKIRPHAVCLDINMPGIDGIETLRRIKTQHPRMAVIMVSSEATMDRVRDAITHGAAGFIIKPFSVAKVSETVGACLKPLLAGAKAPVA